MPFSFFRDTVTIKRPTITKKNGAEVLTWSSTDTWTVSGCQVTAQANAQELGGRTLNLTDKRLLRGPYDMDIQAGDHVFWNGDEYAIDGEVYHSKSPTGRVSTTRCTLIRWQG